MSITDFDLKALQESVIGIPRDLILPENLIDEIRDQRQKSIRKIVDLYNSSRKNNRVFKHTYVALNDSSPFVRVAAADIIGSNGNHNSFSYLFNALEDEEYVHVKQSIASAIDNLEARINKNKNKIDNENVSLGDSMRILSYTI